MIVLLTLRKWCQFWEDRINLAFVRISKNSIAGRAKWSRVNCKLCWDSEEDLLGDYGGELPFILLPVQSTMTYGCSVWTGRTNSSGILQHLKRETFQAALQKVKSKGQKYGRVWAGFFSLLTKVDISIGTLRQFVFTLCSTWQGGLHFMLLHAHCSTRRL